MVNYSLAAFHEPRGVMRILQFVFAICAFATTTNFTNEITASCSGTIKTLPISYPFKFGTEPLCKTMHSWSFASDAQFFVATGVLSLMYCLFIIAVYLFIDDFYKSKSEIPLADFMLTTILAIFWLSGSAAWSNGTASMKVIMEPKNWTDMCAECTQISVASFSRLNISLILGYLNFFLWASDLWFLYKETIWFQGRANQPTTPNV